MPFNDFGWNVEVLGVLGVHGDPVHQLVEKLMTDAGFQDVTFIKTTGYHTSPETEGAIFRAMKPAN